MKLITTIGGDQIAVTQTGPAYGLRVRHGAHAATAVILDRADVNELITALLDLGAHDLRTAS
jgi:hypothetical protein